jgi:hypothetical protein
LKILGISPAFTSPYNAPANGAAERYIKSLSSMVVCYVNEYLHDDWDVQLPYILFAHRSTIQASTLEMPFFLMFGRDPQLPGFLWEQTNLPTEEWKELTDSEKRVPVGDLREEIMTRLGIAWDLARENVSKAQAKQKEWYDANSKMTNFRLGDRVWLAVPQFRKSSSVENATAIKKFAAKWTGPHRIVGVSDNGLTYKLMEIISPLEVIYRTSHLRRLRPFTVRTPIASLEEITLDEAELLSEELALAKSARVLQKKPFRPRAYGTSRELTRRGLGSDSEGEPRTEEDEWEVEKIVNHSTIGDSGERSFRVKWKHHGAAHNSWVNLEDLHAPELLRQYYQRHKLPLVELPGDIAVDISPSESSPELRNNKSLTENTGKTPEDLPVRRSLRSKRGRGDKERDTVTQ